MIEELLVLYITGAVVACLVGPLLLVIIDDLGPDLEVEGRVVLGVVVELLWPLLVVAGLCWVLRRAGRGVAQCVRLVVPRKSGLPRAQVRR